MRFFKTVDRCLCFYARFFGKYRNKNCIRSYIRPCLFKFFTLIMVTKVCYNYPNFIKCWPVRLLLETHYMVAMHYFLYIVQLYFHVLLKYDITFLYELWFWRSWTPQEVYLEGQHLNWKQAPRLPCSSVLPSISLKITTWLG